MSAWHLKNCWTLNYGEIFITESWPHTAGLVVNCGIYNKSVLEIPYSTANTLICETTQYLSKFTLPDNITTYCFFSVLIDNAVVLAFATKHLHEMTYYHKQRLLWYIQVHTNHCLRLTLLLLKPDYSLEKYADVLATPEARASAAMVLREEIAGSFWFP